MDAKVLPAWNPFSLQALIFDTPYPLDIVTIPLGSFENSRHPLVMTFESQAVSEKGMASADIPILSDSSNPSDMSEASRNTTKGVLGTLIFNIILIWEFNESDFPTFVIPNTAFGILGALAGSRLADGPAPGLWAVAVRLPLVIAFNWYNLLIFDLANQRLPESVKEDEINKPW
jgi:hypothetical protein